MPKPDTLSWLFADQPGPPIHGGQHADRRAVELEKQIQAVRADPAVQAAYFGEATHA